MPEEYNSIFHLYDTCYATYCNDANWHTQANSTFSGLYSIYLYTNADINNIYYLNSINVDYMSLVRFLPSVKCYALRNKSITYVIESITEVYYVSQDFKLVLLKNFFIFHPILMKLGEI